MDEKIFSDLEQKIVKSFSKKDLVVYNRHVDRVKFNGNDPRDLFLPLSKVSILIFGYADLDTLTSRQPPRINVNAPILDGLFPLHLAVLTSPSALVRKLYESYEAKLDVKCCGDPDSPFYGLTPLELALLVMRRHLIPWTPQMSVHELLSKFHGDAKVKSLMANISILTRITPRIRNLITEYSLQGKVVELATLLEVASLYPIYFSTVYIPTADIPPELQFGVPMTLRLLVASRSASLVKVGIQLSASLNPEEFDNCRTKHKEMDAVMTLLESAERGDLIGFDEKQQLTAEITDGSSEGSQDKSEVNTAPQYLNNSLWYVEPSKFQPPGIFNSLMPYGYKDSLPKYDGLDIRNCNALAETIFRVLDGTKLEELSLQDTFLFRDDLKNCLKNKFKEAETLTALEEKGTKNEAEGKQWSTPGSSLPRSLATALKHGSFFPLNKAFEHLDVKNISTLVISAVKKGKA